MNYSRQDSVLGKRSRSKDSDWNHVGGGLFFTGETPAPPAPPVIVLSDSEEDEGFADMNHEEEGDEVKEEANRHSDGQSDEDEQSGEEERSDDGDEHENDDIYSQEQEMFPRAAAYDEFTINLQQRAKNLVTVFSEFLQAYRGSSGDVDRLAARVSELVRAPESKLPIIMLLGHTGTGKSSTINSVADELEAARAAAAGESCTCVPTMLVYEVDGQQKDFGGEVRFMSPENRRAFLREQTVNYIRFHFQLDPSLDPEEQKDLQQLADTALKIFRALFNDCFEFESSTSVHAFFRDGMNNNQDQLVEKLDTMCINLLESSNIDEDGRMFHESDELEELNRFIDPHIFERGDFSEPALWPIVDHVCKGIRTSRILKYVKLLDLPGNGDTNRVRAEIAHRFIQVSDALWAVTSIVRPVSDGPLDKALSTYAERFGDKIAIIATGSDRDVNAGLAQSMREKKQSIADWEEHAQEVKRLEKEIANISSKLRPSKGQKRARKMSRNDENELLREQSELREQLQESRNQQLMSLVSARNAYISRRLEEDKQKHLAPHAALSVFCVSNSHYQVYKGDAQSDTALMDVDLTNIPALREHALNIASAQRFNDQDGYISSVLTVLNGGEVYSQSTSADHDQKCRSIARTPGKVLKSALDSYRLTCHTACSTLINEPLCSGRRVFVRSARRFVDEISQWHPSTIRAFFTKEGRHQTASQPFTIWNERFTHEQTEAIDKRWKALVVQQKNDLLLAVGQVIRAIDAIPEQLDDTSIAMRPLQDMVNACSNRIVTVYDTIMIEFDKRLRNIKLQATRDVPTGYFKAAMLYMYELCKTYTGSGCTARMLQSLKDCLDGVVDLGPYGSPFEAVTSELAKHLRENLEWLSQSTEGRIGEILDEMMEHIESLPKKELNEAEVKARIDMGEFFHSHKGEMDFIKNGLWNVKVRYGIRQD